MPQGSILGPLLFLIYINDLSENIESTVKLFADDTSLFSLMHNNSTSAEVLNRDLQKISQWPHKWKMSFNPDPDKPVCFSNESKSTECINLFPKPLFKLKSFFFPKKQATT